MIEHDQIINSKIQKKQQHLANEKAARLIENGVALYRPNSIICCFIGVIKYDDEGEKFFETLGSGKNWDEAFSYVEGTIKINLTNGKRDEN